MFATSGDFLNMALGIGFLVLVIFLCIMIFYVIVILRDAAKVIDDVSAVSSRVSTTIIQPLKAVDGLMEKLAPYIETLVEKRKKGKK